jgi:putative methylase
LGCGSGRLGIGALIMGAKEVIGVDVDKSVLKTARENVKITEKLTKKRIKDKISFVHSDIISFKEKADTVIQNPPFGIQKIHADRLFLERALESSEKVYSLHRSYSKTRNFLKKFIKEKNGKVERIIKFKFRIPYMFRFHKKPHIEYDVDLLIISKV